jgi:enoyl-CoA hydratase
VTEPVTVSLLLAELGTALDRAAADRAVVVLPGRAGVFSAGFDLPVLRGGGTAAADLLQAGFNLAARLLSFPTPVVVACPGHAIAMGAFLVLSGRGRGVHHPQGRRTGPHVTARGL